MCYDLWASLELTRFRVQVAKVGSHAEHLLHNTWRAVAINEAESIRGPLALELPISKHAVPTGARNLQVSKALLIPYQIECLHETEQRCHM